MATEQLNGMDHQMMQIEQQVQENQSDYVIDDGEITEIFNQDGVYSILVGTLDNGIRFVMKGNEVIIDAKTLEYKTVEDLKEGMKLTVVSDKNAPMTMSLPAMTSGQLAMVINDEEHNIAVGKFNAELVDEVNLLALNVAPTTYIANTLGIKKIFTEEDIQNQNALVVYTTTTRSIPAQTTPEMVLILPTTKKDDTQDLELQMQEKNKENTIRQVPVEAD